MFIVQVLTRLLTGSIMGLTMKDMSHIPTLDTIEASGPTLIMGLWKVASGQPKVVLRGWSK